MGAQARLWPQTIADVERLTAQNHVLSGQLEAARADQRRLVDAEFELTQLRTALADARAAEKHARQEVPARANSEAAAAFADTKKRMAAEMQAIESELRAALAAAEAEACTAERERTDAREVRRLVWSELAVSVRSVMGCHVCPGTALICATSAPTAATSAPGPGPTLATSAPGPGRPQPLPRRGVREPRRR